MKERNEITARKFNILDKVKKLESELLDVDGVTEVDFDLNDMYDNMEQVIFLTKYNIPYSFDDNYYAKRRKLIDDVIKTAANNGLERTIDNIEDFGTWFYFVMRCDNTWNCI